MDIIRIIITDNNYDWCNSSIINEVEKQEILNLSKYGSYINSQHKLSTSGRIFDIKIEYKYKVEDTQYIKNVERYEEYKKNGKLTEHYGKWGVFDGNLVTIWDTFPSEYYQQSGLNSYIVMIGHETAPDLTSIN